MIINFSKCKVIPSSKKRIVLEGEKLETVGELCFLDSLVPSLERGVSQRIDLPSIGRHRNDIFSKRSISTRLKARLCGALILPMTIYGVEVWMLRSQEIQYLEVFEMRCLRAIRGATRTDRL